jgi:hypothetical protein
MTLITSRSCFNVVNKYVRLDANKTPKKSDSDNINAIPRSGHKQYAMACHVKHCKSLVLEKDFDKQMPAQ